MKIHKSTSKKKPVYLRVEIFLICNGYAEIITNPEGFLAHGVIRYYFEKMATAIPLALDGGLR